MSLADEKISPKEEKQKIAVVLHQASSSTGRIGQILQKNGFELSIYRPVLGDCLPTTLKDYAGAIIFGGPMSANDNEPFINREMDWISVALKENKPFLGICLGAQLLARNLGGTVKPRSDGEVEIGWYPIEATGSGKRVMDWPKMVYHFHSEGIYDLPQGAELLAKGNTYPTQAFRYGENAWGLQFHSELTRAMMQRWVVHGAERLELKGAQCAKSQLEGRFIYDPALRRWIEQALVKMFGKPKQNIQS
ncbi:glutamine amidotransferase [Bartonella sp. W8098]|uniref:glutamine amidotransferase n=2 Tax=Bartonella TaxID=773 RepID=UPI0018DC8578|nr:MULTISPECIES: glutamine amidotransferase [Bartonella]MBH9987089.1 glutamine amidotransferase [Bartonella apis]MBI0170861.1 glutamine amidotransferase [Bartonella sp. W8151]